MFPLVSTISFTGRKKWLGLVFIFCTSSIFFAFNFSIASAGFSSCTPSSINEKKLSRHQFDIFMVNTGSQCNYNVCYDQSANNYCSKKPYLQMVRLI
jgi:hypothetical protein